MRHCKCLYGIGFTFQPPLLDKTMYAVLICFKDKHRNKYGRILNTKIRIEITSSNKENEIINKVSVKLEDVEDSFENAGLNLIQSPPEVKAEISQENVKIEEISNAEGSEDVLIFPMSNEEVKIEDQVFEETDRLWLFKA